MKPRFASMTAGLAVGVTAVVVVACGAAAYLYSSHHYETLLNTARRNALRDGELIRAALEHQMMENDRRLIARMVESVGREPQIERVALVDRNGVERYSSGGGKPGTKLSLDSPTCQACHRFPPDKRGTSRVVETRGGSVLRTVVPIHNRPECHRCHDPNHRINGVLILDLNTAAVQDELTADLAWMVGGTGALTLILVGAIAFVIHLFVVRRLRRFETAARQIASGDLERRVPATGTDTLAWMAREFNTMADSVTGLVGEVRKQQQRLETVINSIDDGIVVLDGDRRIIAANDAWLGRSGCSRNDVLGCNCRPVALSGCVSGECPAMACLRTGERQVRIFERAKPGGGIVWEEVHASPVPGPDGRPLYIVEVWRDISDRRAAEARLAESHRLASVGMLASGFSHELNTPLATVLTCVEGILRSTPANGGGNPDAEYIRETASIAREQVLRCRGITQHFLRMSRGQESQPEIVEVASILASAVRLVEPAARELKVAVELEPVEAGLRVFASEAELQHAIINLLLNAIQACKPGGKVTAGASDGDTVRIRIADNGCGIPQEHLRRIFEPFFSMRNGGTGLGLFLSLNFIRHCGGDIRVESAAGSGSVFEIALPAFAGAAATGEVR